MDPVYSNVVLRLWNIRLKLGIRFVFLPKSSDKSSVAVIQYLHGRLESQWLLDARSKFLGAKLTFPLAEINDSLSATVLN